MQEFATAIELLAHCVYSPLPEDHIRKEAGKVFADRVEDTAIKIQLLLGGEKIVYEALRQAPKLQGVLLAARPKKRAAGHSGGADRSQLGEETKDDWCAGALGSHATSGVTALWKGGRKRRPAQEMRHKTSGTHIGTSTKVSMVTKKHQSQTGGASLHPRERRDY